MGNGSGIFSFSCGDNNNNFLQTLAEIPSTSTFSSKYYDWTWLMKPVGLESYDVLTVLLLVVVMFSVSRAQYFLLMKTTSKVVVIISFADLSFRISSSRPTIPSRKRDKRCCPADKRLKFLLQTSWTYSEPSESMGTCQYILYVDSASTANVTSQEILWRDAFDMSNLSRQKRHWDVKDVKEHMVQMKHNVTWAGNSVIITSATSRKRMYDVTFGLKDIKTSWNRIFHDVWRLTFVDVSRQRQGDVNVKSPSLCTVQRLCIPKPFRKTIVYS